jgi:hypothetical protein
VAIIPNFASGTRHLWDKNLSKAIFFCKKNAQNVDHYFTMSEGKGSHDCRRIPAKPSIKTLSMEIFRSFCCTVKTLCV